MSTLTTTFSVCSVHGHRSPPVFVVTYPQVKVMGRESCDLVMLDGADRAKEIQEKGTSAKIVGVHYSLGIKDLSVIWYLVCHACHLVSPPLHPLAAAPDIPFSCMPRSMLSHSPLPVLGICELVGIRRTHCSLMMTPERQCGIHRMPSTPTLMTPPITTTKMSASTTQTPSCCS